MEKYINLLRENNVKNSGAEAEIFITIPKEVQYFKVLRAPIIFCEGKVPKNWYGVEFVNKKLNATWVYENINLDKIKFVDELETSGYQYIEINENQVILTHINNAVAKQFALPKMVNGKKVIAYNFVYGLNNDFNVKQKFVQDLGNDLYNEYCMHKGKIKDKIENSQKWLYEELANEPIGKYDQGILNDAYNDFERKRQQQEVTKINSEKPAFNWSLLWTCLGCGISVGIVVGIPLWLIVGLINSNMDFGRAFKWFLIVPFAVSVLIGLILCIKRYKSDKKQLDDRKYFLNNNRDRFTSVDMFQRIYDRFYGIEPSLCYNAVCEVERVLKSTHLRVIQNERKQSKREYENARYELNDLLKNGTKEQQERRHKAEVESALNEIKNDIKEINDTKSYDVYDENNNKIGRIDKK